MKIRATKHHQFIDNVDAMLVQYFQIDNGEQSGIG